ncbi:MAG: cupin domain-containing protein [Pseudomonadota bacterium]
MLLSDRELKGVAPRDDHPKPGDVLSGNPGCRCWEVDAGSGRRIGIKETRPGSWRVHGQAQEFTHILSGRAILRPEGGRALHLGPGDSLTVRRGFRGVWEVVETLRREFVTEMR